MSDEADEGNQRAAEWVEQAITLARTQGITPGEPGECWDCGEEVPRLVRGLCPRCRDRRSEP